MAFCPAMGVPRIISLIVQLTRRNLADPAEIAAVQEKRFRKLLRRAVAGSAFYRELYKGKDLKTCRLTDLPTVNKKQMMANFDDFVTDRRLKRTEIRKWLEDKNNLGKMYLKKYILFHTSGTTGENALVVYDRRALDHIHAVVIARHALEAEPTGWEKLKIFFETTFREHHRLATVVMTGGPYPAYTAALFTPPLHHLFVNHKVFSLLDPIDRIVKDLNEFQPYSMFCYPSLLELLAREQLEGRLNISLNKFASSLSAGSEPLSASTKRLAREAWGKDVQDTYGTSECFVMARSCRHFDRMHVMTDLCILEVVDRNNNPVPPGQAGDKILITNLFNYAQPFIRYEISDVTGYSTEPCGCGWPFPTLLPVEGRTDDIFYIDRPGGGYEGVHPYLFLGPIVELDEVREYQLAQTGRNEVTFSFVPVGDDPGIEQRVRKVLEDGMAMASLSGRIHLITQRVPAIPRDARSGKFRAIISRIGPPADLDEPRVCD